MKENVNSIIIEPVFQSLLKKADEDSELYYELELLARKNSPFTVQKKGSKIIESFPWPIGKELSALFSSSYLNRDQSRVLKIFHVAERIAQFFAYCWLIQIWDAKRHNPTLELTLDFVTQFKGIKKPSLGTYLGIIRSSNTILQDSDLPTFFEKDKISVNVKLLIAEIEKLTTHRNNEIHFKDQVICEDAEDILAKILINAAFIANYPMVSIKDINVSKHKLGEAKYVHMIEQLNCQRSDFSGSNIELDKFSDSYSVMLIENLSSMGKFLNLSPFIINTEPFLESRGRNNVLQGLYMFSQVNHEKIKYAFVNESEIHGLDEMPQKHILQVQWNNLFEVLSSS